MRLSLATVLFAVCFNFVLLSGRALAEGSAEAAPVQPKDWISMPPAAVTVSGVDDRRGWSQVEAEPVLLPLPAESWTGIGLLAAVVIYCGVRRARLLAVR